MSQQTQQSQFQLGPFFGGYQQWRDAIIGAAGPVAMSTMMFVRARVGFDILTLGALFGTAFLLYVLNAIGNFHVSVPLAGRTGAAHQTESLRNFGLLVLGFGLWLRRKRWGELVAGELWHTFSHGISYFEFLPIRQDLVYRFIDPGVTFLAGLILRKIGFMGLGLWVMFSAVCFRLIEERTYEIGRRRDLDIHNSLVESRIQADTVAYFTGKDDVKARSLKDTGGLPTGADAGLEAQIARRKKNAAGRSPEVGA